MRAASPETQSAAVGHGLNTPAECGSNPSSTAPGGRQEAGMTQLLTGGSWWSDAADKVCAPQQLESAFSPLVMLSSLSSGSFLALHPGYASY